MRAAGSKSAVTQTGRQRHTQIKFTHARKNYANRANALADNCAIMKPRRCMATPQPSETHKHART
eukprot:6209696-Pleurochrysis_carterae.AAC.1